MRPGRCGRMLTIALVLGASPVLAARLSAQQSGRLQVHATVVDVSSSLDARAVLRRQVGFKTGQVLPVVQQRPWLMITTRGTPSVATGRETRPQPRAHPVTIFYF